MTPVDTLLGVDYWQSRQLLALFNWAICCAIGWACICRISVTSIETTRGLTRWSYAALFAAATASGYGPFADHWPGWADVAMSTAVLLLMLDGAKHWRLGLPNDARR